ncbi:MAG: SH3 domain-containing protein [Clostridia bacterium]|nr:SH3 domain-containing protein [Clostridia bacterium]
MQVFKKVLSIVLCVCLLMVSLNLSGLNSLVLAETVYTGIVKVDDYLNVRSSTSTSSSVLGSLGPDATVTIYGDKVSGSGIKWYKINYNGQTGYVSAEYITNVQALPEYNPDASFEENLTAQGFPESYKVLLRKLHANHPNWIFLGDKLNVSWADAFAAQNKNGKSLIHGTAKASWKSMEQDAYNWNQGYYYEKDSGGWVVAAKEVVAYYLEPRNFLNEDNIYVFLNQGYDASSQNIDDLNKILKGTFMEKPFPEDTYSSYAAVIMEAAKQSGASPYAIAATIIQEQGANGSGRSISGTVPGYEGYYNYVNYGAYKDSQFNDAVVRGLWCASGKSGGSTYDRPWNTHTKSIIGGAKYYASNYIKAGQDTLYYKKFDVITSTLYDNQYMSNIAAAVAEASKLKAAVSKADKLVFSIPIYKNMPDNYISSLPTSNGANNYYLSSLSVNGYNLTPTYSMYNYNYELVVSLDTASVDINAKAVSGATASGTGKKDLKEGANTFEITVTAASGFSQKYVVTIHRQEGGATSSPTAPSISGNYNVGDYITKVAPTTDVSTFMSNIKVDNGSAKLISASGSEKTSGNVATGDVLVVSSSSGEAFRKTIVIYGDNNGDGKVSIVDAANIKRHVLEIRSLNGQYNEAADTNKDGKITIVDFANIKRHILDIRTINQ